MTEPPVESNFAGGQRLLIGRVAGLGLATVAVKLIALGKDLLIARLLGAGDALDAYLVAFLLPSYAAVVLGQTFAAAFVPIYVQRWHGNGLAAAQQTAGAVLSAALAILTAVCLALWIAAPWLLPLIGSGFDTTKLVLTTRLFYPMVVVVLASGATAVVAAVLNAHERFAAVALAPCAIPLASLAALWLGRDDAVYALALGTTLGFVGETIIVFAAAWRSQLLPRLRWPAGAPELAHIAASYWPLLLGGMLMSSAMLVDQGMAAYLGSGQVSILNYGGKIVAVVLTIVAASISTALFPRFTHLIAAGQLTAFRRLLTTYSIGIVVLSIPGVLLLAYLSEPLVRWLFERGAFDAETTRAVSHVQLWLIPQIPFYVLCLLGARVLSALDGNLTVLRIAVLNVVSNVAGNLLLMPWFGVRGIAMSTSLTYVLAAGATLLAIRAKLSARQVKNPPDDHV